MGFYERILITAIYAYIYTRTTSLSDAVRHYYGELNVKQRNLVWLFYFANITVTEIDLDNAI